MFPPATCEHLARRGQDAVHVKDRGLNASPDSMVAAVAAQEHRVIVTENVKDFTGCREVVVACILKSRLPVEGLANRLAELLDRWTATNPEPFIGLHWPPTRE